MGTIASKAATYDCSQSAGPHNHRDKPRVHGMPHDRIDTSVDDSLLPFFLESNDWHGKGIDLHRESHDPPAYDVERESEK